MDPKRMYHSNLFLDQEGSLPSSISQKRSQILQDFKVAKRKENRKTETSKPICLFFKDRRENSCHPSYSQNTSNPETTTISKV
jgi:hypothetical protein